LKQPGTLQAHAVDARDSNEVASLIRATGAQIVINVAQAFVNMPVLDACIECGVAYMDTAIHEDPDKICETPPWYGNYEWKRREACRQGRRHRHSGRRL
jgi:saccharopine dehydrogenase-like NADP-dependent oxidoreductase